MSHATPLLISVNCPTKRIVLSGDLDASPATQQHYLEAMKNVSECGHEWIVDASDVRVRPEGVTLWIRAVHDLLSDCKLIYTSSQLAMILQYEDRYRHENSVFLEDDGSPIESYSQEMACGR